MKNLVALCDGTSNSIEMDVSNVGRLLRCLAKNERQRVYYRPGVGSSARQAVWSERLRQAKAIFQLATGYGIDDDVCAIYRFLCENYEEGDQISLFGFSRGAYTVRIVAALIRMVGLLAPDQANLTEQLLAAYKRIGEKNGQASDEDFGAVSLFTKYGEARAATVHFLGLFDTVSSVIVPGRNFFGLLPGTSKMPYTRSNSSVRAVRHAVAIDERRVMFRANLWADGQRFASNPFATGASRPSQDCKQLLFAGVHADVGGGYAEKESGLAKIALEWMVHEAGAHDIQFIGGRVDRFIKGVKRYETDRFVPPDPAGCLHRSLKGAWWLLEAMPRRRPKLDSRPAWYKGWYMAFEEPRLLEDHGKAISVHRSVEKRMAANAGYAPPNLPVPPTFHT